MNLVEVEEIGLREVAIEGDWGSVVSFSNSAEEFCCQYSWLGFVLV